MSTSAEVTAGVCANPLTGSGWVFVIWQTRAFPPERDFTGGGEGCRYGGRGSEYSADHLCSGQTLNHTSAVSLLFLPVKISPIP